jgi:hypothetical protein
MQNSECGSWRSTLKTGGQSQRDDVPVMIKLKELRDANLNLKQKIAAEFEVCGFQTPPP